MMRKFGFTVLISFCLFSCLDKEKGNSLEIKNSIQLEWRLEENKNILNKYFSELKISPKKLDTVFFIPLNSCESCLNLTLESIIKNNFKGKVILGGNPEYYNSSLIELDSINNKYIDTNDLMIQYNLSIIGPTVMILDTDKKSNKLTNLTADNIHFLCKEFNWKKLY